MEDDFNKQWPVGDEPSEFGVYCDGIPEVFTEGPRGQALEKALHHAAQYAQDGKVTVHEILRREIKLS